MGLGSKHKVESNFSLSSMTDIVFLLLIFFMLTSSFITPSGLPVNLPSSKESNIVLQRISVTITEDLQYFVNKNQVDKSSLEPLLKSEISKADENTLVLHIDKTVPVEELVYVAGIAARYDAKVSIATKPE